MSDLQILIDMGFPHEKAARALEVTNNKGVEPAMEWLLAHMDEVLPPNPTTSDEQTSATLVLQEPASSDALSDTEATTASESEQAAKSLKCNECDRLFKTQMEIEFHAAKSGHSSFSESTEEKKPLTEDEKKEQLAKLEEKLKLKRLEREEKEKLEALEREKLRIKSGKDMSEARRRMEEIEMQKIVEQRKREKLEEKAARERVKAQIEADKAARKARLAADMGQPITPEPEKPTPAPQTNNKVPSTYSNTKIQIRLMNGNTLTETFDVKEPLSAVRLFIQLKQGTDIPFGLITSFPRKLFGIDDYEKPLDVLGLVPSAVIIVTKP